MRKRSWMAAGLAMALASCLVTPARAGGFGILAELPRESDRARMKGIALVVLAAGCHGPGATLTGTAEGIVGGQRRTVPLQFTRLGTDSRGITRYGLAARWPKQGVWALTFEATAPGRESGGKLSVVFARALVKVEADGGFKPAPYASPERRYVEVHPAERELSRSADALLREMSRTRSAAR